MNKKYELTDQISVINGYTVYRIKALKGFTLIDGTKVKAGDLGGYIQSEHHLSQVGSCWVGENSYVYGGEWFHDPVTNKSVYRANSGMNAGDCGKLGALRGAEGLTLETLESVAENAYIFGNAVVTENAKVHGNAVVFNDVRISGRAMVSGNACVFENVEIGGAAVISGDAIIANGAVVSGDEKCGGSDRISGDPNIQPLMSGSAAFILKDGMGTDHTIEINRDSGNSGKFILDNIPQCDIDDAVSYLLSIQDPSISPRFKDPGALKPFADFCSKAGALGIGGSIPLETFIHLLKAAKNNLGI